MELKYIANRSFLVFGVFFFEAHNWLQTPPGTEDDLELTHPPPNLPVVRLQGCTTTLYEVLPLHAHGVGDGEKLRNWSLHSTSLSLCFPYFSYVKS